MGEIIIGSLGGTIAMTRDPAATGATPSLTAKALLDSIPGLSLPFPVSAHSVLQLPSASIGLDDMMTVLDWCMARADEGAQGIVLTQGTDAIEETSWLLDLFWPHDIPLIVTGAMRTPDSAGADGPANLRAALQVACDPHSAGRGVLVVMNDLIHSPRRVRKKDTVAPDAFCSGKAGVLGRVVEGAPVYFAPPLPRRTLPLPRRRGHDIALVPMCLGTGAGLLRAALTSAEFAGVVVVGFGAGHVPRWLAEVIGAHAAERPVVICSRCADGPTTRETYGYPGSEVDLMARGAWMGGWLSPEKARLLLWAIAAGGTDPGQMRSVFETFSRP